MLSPFAGLPFGKDLVDSKPALRGSNTPAIQLWPKPCWANLFDGQVAAGPIPVLLSQFAEDPDLIQVAMGPTHNSKFILLPKQFFSLLPRSFTSCLDGLPKGEIKGDLATSEAPICYLAQPYKAFFLSQADPAAFHGELQRLATCFFKPDAISWKEALNLAKKPRGGKGEAAFIRKRPSSTPVSGPVAKRPKSASSATGRLTCLFLLLFMSAHIHTASFLIPGPDTQVCHPKEASQPMGPSCP